MRCLITILMILNVFVLQAQTFDPPAGQEGSLAIPGDSPQFVGWASHCEVIRGYGIINFPDSVIVDFGVPEDAIGMAGDGRVVSLGDSGVAILSFDSPVSNGPGPDFAVFENAFLETFLELAFVEVSSDDINYFRFPSVSLTPVDSQVVAFGSLDATLIHNLAGKYIQGFGTPFDLEELSDQPGLDINAITSVKIVDVIGSVIDSLATHDSKGNIVNDPWPTPFDMCGFDLDAVGVIHNQITNNQTVRSVSEFTIFPNPASDWIHIALPDHDGATLRITSINGQTVHKTKILSASFNLDISHWLDGFYIIQIMNETGVIVTERIIKE
jgi:hypothetical protein